MSDFIKKAKEEKDINNGSAIVSSRTDGAAPEHHVQNSQLSEKAQTDNETKLENKFGNKFKYFDSAAEIEKMQSKGGGVNKTLSQVQSRLSDVKEKSETVVTKAEENKDFNSGGTVSNAGGGSKFSDTLETNLSQKDQSDTATVINDKIGQSVQTGSNSGSQDATAIREEIINNDQAIANADASTDSDGLTVGGCKGAKTRGQSRTLQNAISVSLTDESGNFGPSAALYGDIPCDCYVPLNLPLLGALTKSAKLIGGFTNVFQGLLKFVGVWGKYTAAVGDAARKAKGFRWHQGLKKFMHPLEGELSALKKAMDQLKINTINLANQAGDALYALNQAKRKREIALNNLSVTETALNDTLPFSLGKLINATPAELPGLLNQLTSGQQAFWNGYNQALNFLSVYDPAMIAQLQSNYNNLSVLATAARIAELEQRSKIDGTLRAIARVNKEVNELIAQCHKSDALGLLSGLIGIGFDALAALDPVRKKECLGTGTTRNEKTCACDCSPGYTEGVGGTGDSPEWSLLDFIAPVQSDELKRCYPACPCNMERGLVGPRGSDLECSDCKSGYTWYAGATCECERTTGYDHGFLGLQKPVRKTEIGTCVKSEQVTANASLGKTWDSKACGFKCGPDTDVGNKDKPFGTYHRLNDNYPAIAPSKHHALYATGCTYVCDGRDRPEGTPWPPDCVGGFFNTEKCECAPTNCPQYMGHNALVLQNVSYGLDPDTGEPLDYDNFWSVYETRRGGSTSLGLPAGATVTPPGGGQDYGLYIDSASAQGYEFSADPRRYVEWSSSRVRYKAFECNDDGTLGSDITGSVIDITGVTGALESCYQETYGENPRDPPTESETDTWLGCLSLNYGVAGVSSVNPDIIP